MIKVLYFQNMLEKLKFTEFLVKDEFKVITYSVGMLENI